VRNRVQRVLFAYLLNTCNRRKVTVKQRNAVRNMIDAFSIDPMYF